MNDVASVVRGLSVIDAQNQLAVMPQKAAGILAGLFQSAVSNAENNFDLDKDGLKVAQILIGQGATLKRWQPRAFGRAYPIRKRTCQVNLVLEGEKKLVKSRRAKDSRVEPVSAKEEKEKKGFFGRRKVKTSPGTGEVAQKGFEKGSGKSSQSGAKGRFFRRKSG